MDTHIKPTSQSLRDYGQYQRGFMLMVFVVSGAYWAAARYMGSSVFDPDQYGPFIMSFHAEAWLAPIFFASGLHLVAQVVNGDDRLPRMITPAIRFAASLVVAVDLIMFAVGGLYAPYYDLYFAYTGIVGCICLWFAWLGFGDLRRGYLIGKGSA